MGDSIAWGYGVSDEETASFYLQQILKGTDYQVHNLGIAGFGIGQYYLHLKSNLDFLPRVSHVILILHAAYDLDESRSNYACGKKTPLFFLKDGSLSLVDADISKFNLRNLFSSSYFLQRIANRYYPLKAFLNKIAGDREITFEEAKEVMPRLLDEMNELTQSRGGKFTVLLSPSLFELEGKSEDYEWFEEVCEVRALDCIDYLGYLEKNVERPFEDLYIDPSHYGPQGNRVLAEAIHERMIK